MIDNKLSKDFAAIKTPDGFEICLYEVDGDDRLFVTAANINKALGFSGGFNKNNSYLAYAINAAETPLYRFIWRAPNKQLFDKENKMPYFFDVLDVPTVLDSFSAVGAGKSKNKKERCKKAQALRDWFSTTVIPAFYEDVPTEESNIETENLPVVGVTNEPTPTSAISGGSFDVFDDRGPYYHKTLTPKGKRTSFPDENPCMCCPLFQAHEKKCEYDRRRRREMSPEQREEYRQKQRAGFHSWYNGLSTEERAAYLARSNEYCRKWRARKRAEVDRNTAKLL